MRAASRTSFFSKFGVFFFELFDFLFSVVKSMSNLFSGFFEVNFLQHSELHGPPAYFTSDWRAAKSSVRRLADLEPATVAPGHGKPLAGADVAESLRKLAGQFEEVAVPENVKAT